MPDPRFLLVRLGSMGDILHALPAASALRDAFSGARIDWAVERKWARLLEGNPDLTHVVIAERASARGIASTVRELRAARYDCVVDFQALYKSALLALASGSRRRIGFSSGYAREGWAAHCYTERANPRGPHKVHHNLTLARLAGAKSAAPRFPLAVRAEDEDAASRELEARNFREFFVLNPGGGWRSKCWPAERYGKLHRRLFDCLGLRGIVTYGPGEDDLAREVIAAAGQPAPVPLALGLGPLMALMRRAKFMVSADTGPLHLAAALETPIVGLYGPTDPARNGPFGAKSLVVRNPSQSHTDYSRGENYSAAMLSIEVDQVLEAAQRLARPADAGVQTA